MTDPAASGSAPATGSDPAPEATATAAAPTRSTVVDIVPDWLENLAALGWRVFVIAALIVACWLLATELFVVTASILVAIVIAATFAPVVVRLRAKGRSRTAAAAIVWVIALVVVVGAMVILGLALLPYVADVLEEIAAGVEQVQADLAALNLPPAAGTVLHDRRGRLSSRHGRRDRPDRHFGGRCGDDRRSSPRSWCSSSCRTATRRGSGSSRRSATGSASGSPTAGDDALWRVGGYLRGTTVLSAIIATTDFVFMVVLGVPLALPLALLVFFSGYIPYFGGIVATFIILIVAYAALGAGPVVVLLVLIAIRNMILGYGIRPTIYGRSVSMHPAMVLVALPAGYELAGVVGLFAAVPVTAIIMAVANATIAILDPGPRPELPALVPAWLDRVAQWSWRILVAVAPGRRCSWASSWRCRCW